MNYNLSPGEHDKISYSVENPRVAPLAAAFYGLLIVLGLNTIIGAVLHLLIFGFKTQDFSSAPMRMLQITNQLWFFLLPGLVLSLYIYKDVTKVIRFKLPALWELAAFGAGMLLLIPLLGNFSVLQNYLISNLAEKNAIVRKILDSLIYLDRMTQDAYSSLLRPENFIDKILIICVVAITPAICEEVFFRGFLQKSFELRFTKFWGAFITAFFFALLHMNPFGTIPLFILGLYFGYAVYRTNSIFVSMFLHFLNNFIATIVVFFTPAGGKDSDVFAPVSLLEFRTSTMTVLSLTVLFGLVLYLINYYYSKQKFLS